MTKDLNGLAKSLYLRRGTGTVPERCEIRIGDWRPRPNHCHFNVSELLERSSEYRPVRGWCAASYEALGYMRFFSHSIVEDRNGKLMDITPNPTPWVYPFIRHLEVDGDFAEIVETLGVIHLDYLLPR